MNRLAVHQRNTSRDNGITSSHPCPGFLIPNNLRIIHVYETITNRSRTMHEYRGLHVSRKWCTLDLYGTPMSIFACSNMAIWADSQILNSLNYRQQSAVFRVPLVSSTSRVLMTYPDDKRGQEGADSLMPFSLTANQSATGQSPRQAYDQLACYTATQPASLPAGMRPVYYI